MAFLTILRIENFRDDSLKINNLLKIDFVQNFQHAKIRNRGKMEKIEKKWRKSRKNGQNRGKIKKIEEKWRKWRKMEKIEEKW